jgi:hypothetical protein
MERRSENSLVEELRAVMPELFDKHRAVVVRDPAPWMRRQEMGCVCLESGNLIFRFGEWHGEYHQIRVAPKFAPTESFQLLEIVRLVDPLTHINTHLRYVSWREYWEVLAPRFQFLETVLSPIHFQDTKARIAQMRASR